MNHHSKEEIPQFLKDLKSTNAGYNVPPDYFAKMQDSVLSQVIEPKTVKQIEQLGTLEKWYHIIFKPQFALVAIAAMILIGVFIGTGNNTSEVHNSLSTLEDTDLDYFLENEIDDLHDQDLMATLSADELDFNNYSFPTVSENMSIPDDYIEDLENTTLIDFELED